MDRESLRIARKQWGVQQQSSRFYVAETYSFEVNKNRRRILAEGRVKNQSEPVPERFFHKIVISECYSETQYTKERK